MLASWTSEDWTACSTAWMLGRGKSGSPCTDVAPRICTTVTYCTDEDTRDLHRSWYNSCRTMPPPWAPLPFHTLHKYHKVIRVARWSIFLEDNEICSVLHARKQSTLLTRLRQVFGCEQTDLCTLPTLPLRIARQVHEGGELAAPEKCLCRAAAPPARDQGWCLGLDTADPAATYLLLPTWSE